MCVFHSYKFEKKTIRSHQRVSNLSVTIAALEKHNATYAIEIITTLQAEIKADAIAQAPEMNQIVAHIRTCGYCGREGDGLLKCAGCGTVAYCGTRCQRKGWKGGHKVICRRIQRERAEAERTRSEGEGSASSVAEITDDANGVILSGIMNESDISVSVRTLLSLRSLD